MFKRMISFAAVAGLVLALAPAAQAALVLTGPAALPANTDLTTEGTADWAQWGYEDGSGFGTDNKFNQKQVGSTTVGIISDVSILNAGGGARRTYENYGGTFEWTDGTPDTSESGVLSYVYLSGEGNNQEGDGLRFTVNASAGTLKVYLGTYDNGDQGKKGATFTVTLSGGASATSSTDLPTGSSKDWAGVYTVEFSGEVGETLQIDWTQSDGDEVYPRIAAATFVIPEPATMVLIAVGVPLVLKRRRR